MTSCPSAAANRAMASRRTSRPKPLLPFALSKLGHRKQVRAFARPPLHVHDTSCVIADVQMPGMIGVDLQARLLTQGVLCGRGKAAEPANKASVARHLARREFRSAWSDISLKPEQRFSSCGQKWTTGARSAKAASDFRNNSNPVGSGAISQKRSRPMQRIYVDVEVVMLRRSTMPIAISPAAQVSRSGVSTLRLWAPAFDRLFG
jgi:hypothetical protein